MTVDQALEFANPSGEYGQWVKGQVGRVATPMGAYQVVGTTLAAAKEGLGLTGNEQMTPEIQDAIGKYILDTQGTGAWEGYKGPQQPGSGTDYPQVAQAIGMGQPDMARVEKLSGVLDNPYATEAQRTIATQLLQQEFAGGIDPMEAAKFGLDQEDNRLAQERFEWEKNKPQTTDDTTEYNMYVQQATAAGEQPIPFRDWMLQMRKAGASNVSVDTGADGAEDAKFYAGMDEAEAKRWGSIIEGAPLVYRTGQQLGILEQQLAQAPQGAQGAWTAAAGQFGIPLDGLDEVQAAQATINALVPQQRPPGSGTMSDADLALFKGSLPQIINQPGGNALIMETLKAINAYDQQLVAITDQLASREITRGEARKRMREIPNPIDVYKQRSAQLGVKPTKPASGGVKFRYDPESGELVGVE
jgi:hypothetical protein